VYISRDVIFDETVFPFAQHHPNPGMRYTSEVLILPQTTLQDSPELPLDNISTNTNVSSPNLWLSDVV
jgi:hypothetical protein